MKCVLLSDVFRIVKPFVCILQFSFPIVLLIYRKLPSYKVLFNQSGMMQGGGPQGEDRLPGEYALLRVAPGGGQEACRLRRLLLHTGQSPDADLSFGLFPSYQTQDAIEGKIENTFNILQLFL